MAFSSQNHIRCKLVVDSEIIEGIHRFSYSRHDVFCCRKDDVNIKLSRFRRMCGTLRRTLKWKALKNTTEILQIMAVSTLTHDCKNLAVNRTERRKAEAADVKFLRSLAGCKLIDQKRVTDIRAELNLYRLGSKIEHRIRGWYEHALRLKKNRFPHAILQYEPTDHRNVGRPEARWTDGLPCRRTGQKAYSLKTMMIMS